MKARLLFDRQRSEEMRDADGKPVRDRKGRKLTRKVTVPAGTIIDDEDAIQCKLGLAEPADEECRQAVAGLTPEFFERERKLYQMIEWGMLTKDGYDHKAFQQAIREGRAGTTIPQPDAGRDDVPAAEPERPRVPAVRQTGRIRRQGPIRRRHARQSGGDVPGG